MIENERRIAAYPNQEAVHVKLDPLFNDPRAVLVSRTPVSNPVRESDYIRAAKTVLAAMQAQLEGEKAVLKPNITVGELYQDPDSGVTTHPAFVQGLIEYLQARGVKRGGCYILEDPRDTDDNEPRHWRGTGYPEVAQATGAKLRCPTSYTCVKKPVPQPLVFPTLNVSRLAAAPNTVLINVPKLKTHNLAITTLCLKNLMGAVNVYDRHYCTQAWREMPDEQRYAAQGGATARRTVRPRSEWLDAEGHERWQNGLARRLADTAKVLPAQLCIVEGVVGRDGTGFRRGNNVPLGLVIAGTNPVAVDSVASYLMGYDPQALIYLNVAAEAGLGTNVLSELHTYVVQDGAIAACPNLSALRADPPLRAITNIQGDLHQA